MPTDSYLLDRIRNISKSKNAHWAEKPMFGGDGFMVDDKMCFGTYKGGLMDRVAPEEVEALTQQPVAGQGTHGSQPMTWIRIWRFRLSSAWLLTCERSLAKRNEARCHLPNCKVSSPAKDGDILQLGKREMSPSSFVGDDTSLF